MVTETYSGVSMNSAVNTGNEDEIICKRRNIKDKIIIIAYTSKPLLLSLIPLVDVHIINV